MTDKLDDTKLSKIDQAIAAAKARKAAKGDTTAEKPAKAAKAEKAPAKPKMTDEERDAKRATILADREVRKAAKAVEREAARAEKIAARKPAHMSKVLKAAEKLPQLNDTTGLLFTDATTNLSRDQIAALALHLQHFNRVKATERALDAKVEAGVTVRICGGDPRFIGMTGTVAKAQRIRCYVDVAGFTKPVYLFTSDVEVIAALAVATGTEG